MKFLVSLLFLIVVFISSSIVGQQKTITVTIENISSDDGSVGFALYNKELFMKKPIQAKSTLIKMERPL